MKHLFTSLLLAATACSAALAENPAMQVKLTNGNVETVEFTKPTGQHYHKWLAMWENRNTSGNPFDPQIYLVVYRQTADTDESGNLIFNEELQSYWKNESIFDKAVAAMESIDFLNTNDVREVIEIADWRYGIVGNILTVSAGDRPVDLAVYSLSGLTEITAKVTGSQSFDLGSLTRGVHIVRIKDFTFKTIVK